MPDACWESKAIGAKTYKSSTDKYFGHDDGINLGLKQGGQINVVIELMSIYMYG